MMKGNSSMKQRKSSVSKQSSYSKNRQRSLSKNKSFNISHSNSESNSSTKRIKHLNKKKTSIPKQKRLNEKENIDFTKVVSKKGGNEPRLPLRIKKLSKDYSLDDSSVDNETSFSPLGQKYKHSQDNFNKQPQKKGTTPFRDQNRKGSNQKKQDISMGQSDTQTSYHPNIQPYDDANSFQNFYEQQVDSIQKQLIQSKQKIYEQRYKIECLKKRLIETDSAKQEYLSKFEAEQEKSDEFFTKAEKYKMIAKNFKQQIEQLSLELQEITASKEEDIKYYEEALKAIEQKEHAQKMEQGLMIKELVNEMNTITNIAYSIGHGDAFQASINSIYNTLRFMDGSQVRDFQNVQQQQERAVPDLVSEFAIEQSFPQSKKLNKNHDLPKQLSMQKQQPMNTMTYEYMQKVRQDMARIKEEAQKVLEENSSLYQVNKQLQDELQLEKQKSESSLIPQYKEAFDQMRLANDLMQKKIDELEQELQEQPKAQSNEVEVKELKFNLQKLEYENKNLRDEKDMLLSQVQSLESYNKNQEKLISYFQNNYQTMIQQFTLFQQIQQQQQACNQTQPVPQIFSLESTKNMTGKGTTKESLDLIQFANTNSQGDLLHQQYKRIKPMINIDKQHEEMENLNCNFSGTKSLPQSNRSVMTNQVQSNQQQQVMNGQNSTIIVNRNDCQSENDNLFSLSSTQPDQHLRLQSPMNDTIPKQLDFNQKQIEQNELQMQLQFQPNMISHLQNIQFEELKQSQPQKLKGSKNYVHHSKGIIQYANQQFIPEELSHSLENMSLHSFQSKTESRKSSPMKKHNQKSKQQHQMRVQILPYDQISENTIQESTKSKQGQKDALHIEALSQSFNCSQQTQEVKSPTFQDSESEGGHQSYEIEDIYNINKRVSPFVKQQHTKNTENTIQASFRSGNSNFMSERTVNLKKEISSLNEEILLLQNSLKQALLSKGNEL